jgi:hypothetical protein
MTELLPIRATVALVLGATVLVAAHSQAQEAVPVTELSGYTHFHGLAVDRADPSRLYLATHHGLYVVEADGKATRVSENQNDYMGFTPHPGDPGTLFASGHPSGGGNMGVIISKDGGRSWSALSPGVGGPVDFHQMDASAADPNVLYGAFAGSLQVSRDGGRSWEQVGSAPEGLVDLATSAKDANVVYAATQNGLLKSEDGGQSWKDAYWMRRPVTMVQVAPSGEVYAFVVQTGLIRTSEPSLAWSTVNVDLGNAALIHLAVDPSAAQRLYAVTFDLQQRTQGLIASRDGGKTWSPLGSGESQ